MRISSVTNVSEAREMVITKLTAGLLKLLYLAYGIKQRVLCLREQLDVVARGDVNNVYYWLRPPSFVELINDLGASSVENLLRKWISQKNSDYEAAGEGSS